ncbi:MAG TPA: VOC family protein [Candidatus Eisenbacteria bacterium]|nr:VOC family protein [Candidatus Eisenbacteria bacterium]
MFTSLAAFSGFSVKDLSKAKKFYTDVLGLTVVEEKGMGLQLNLPQGGQVFVYDKANHVPATYTILNFVVENIDDAVEELTKKGVKFEQYHMKEMPQDEKGILRGLAAHMGPDIAWFLDPAGNIFAILQEK